MHIVIDSENPGAVLNELSAFRAFVTDIADRCEEPPVATEITLVGSYAVAS